MTDSLPALDQERWRVLEKLRSDALVEVYRAEQIDIGRTVMIKTLRPGVLPSSPFALTLEREAKLLSELDHVNILRLYDFRKRDDSMWLVLEDVEGPSLEALLAEHGRLPPDVTAAIGLQLCRALGHAHGRSVVHRDVQPRNVLISNQGRVKLVAFAVATDQRIPTAPELLDGVTEFGTPQYMSPEQVLGEAPDPRSDLFSLGVVLYECLSGKRPFEAPDSRGVTQRIRHDAPAPLSREVPELPRPFDTVVSRLLQKIPSDRFHEAAELEAALGELCGRRRRDPERVVQEFLSGQPPPSAELAPTSLGSLRPAPPLVPGLLACLVVLAAGASTIELAAARRAGGAAARGSHLRLVPDDAGYLRVVASPWAHVIVDGERVETTPFATPVPLSPGRHFVRLEHPNAPTERRTIELSPTESILLDVEMKIKLPAAAASAAPLPVTGDPDTP